MHAPVSVVELSTPNQSFTFGFAHVQIDANECAWYGRNTCKPWVAVMIVLSVAVVIDFFAGTALALVGKAMEESEQQRLRRCALFFTQACHACVCLLFVYDGEGKKSDFVLRSKPFEPTLSQSQLSL